MPNVNDEIAARNYALAHGMPFDAYGNRVVAPVRWNQGTPGLAMPPGAGGTIAGADPTGYNPASGGVPNLTGTGTILDNLLSSIGGSSGQIGSIIQSLTQSSNQALRDQYSPEYFNLLATTTANANRRANGDISDLAPGIQQNAAERAVAGGVAGSQAYNSKLARDLGLTKYQVEQTALDDLGKIRANTPVVSPIDPKSFMPDFNHAATLQQLADILRSAPIPEEVYKRTMQNIAAGLNNGQSAGYGGGFNRPYTPNQTSDEPGKIAAKYDPSRDTGGTPPSWKTPTIGSNGQPDILGDYFNDEWNAMTPVANANQPSWADWGANGGGGGSAINDPFLDWQDMYDDNFINMPNFDEDYLGV